MLLPSAFDPESFEFLGSSSAERSPQIEVHFDVEDYIHSLAVFRGGSEDPLLERFNRTFVETVTDTADDAHDLHGAVFAYLRFEHHCSLIIDVPRLIRILRLDS